MEKNLPRCIAGTAEKCTAANRVKNPTKSTSRKLLLKMLRAQGLQWSLKKKMLCYRIQKSASSGISETYDVAQQCDDGGPNTTLCMYNSKDLMPTLC